MFKKRKNKNKEDVKIVNEPKGLREKMLTPYLAGLRGDDKPKALILKLSFDVSDQRDVAVDYKLAKQLVEDRGYTVINNDEIIYDVKKGTLNEEKIIADRFSKFNKPITIWLEAHSSPGWIFGAKADFVIEQKAVLMFRNRLVDIEQNTGLYIDNIVLHSCFSATEIINEKNGTYSNSSARLLSIVMPEKNILGFIGLNSGVKVSHIYMPISTSEFEEAHLSLIKGSIVFKAGKAIEDTSEIFFCTQQSAYIKQFILKSCLIETCDILLLAKGPTKENYGKLLSSLKSNIAYLRFEDKLFYLNRSIKEYSEVVLKEGMLEKFDKITNPKEDVKVGKARVLSEEQLHDINLLTKHVAIKSEQQIFFRVCPARETMAQYRKKYQFTEECFADKQITFFEKHVESMKLNITSDLTNVHN